MMNNRTGSSFLKLTLFTALLFLSLTSLWAQNRRYVTEQRFIQRLVWVSDEYAFRYEVVIERNEGEGYREFRREFTTSTMLVISLPLGDFRYCIIPYDYLDQSGEASEWITLNVVAPPVITVETPEAAPAAVPEKQFAMILSAAWEPLIPLYGKMQEIFGNGLYVVGASARFGALYKKPRWFSPGIELSTSWYALDNSQSSDEISMQTGVTGFNIVVQKELPFPGMAITLRAGGAFSFQVGEINIEQYSYTTGGMVPQVNIDLSFLWFAYKQLYLEGGVGFTHLMDKDNDSDCLRPWIGAGWQF